MLKWVVERCQGKGSAVETPIGNLPTKDGLDLSGLDIPSEDLDELLSVDVDGWLSELPSIKEHYDKFGVRLPQGLKDELDGLEQRLNVR